MKSYQNVFFFGILTQKHFIKIKKLEPPWNEKLEHSHRVPNILFIDCTSNFSESKLFFKLLKRFSTFNVFRQDVLEFCSKLFHYHIYADDLIFRLYIGSLFLKSYKLSLNLKTSVINSGASRLFTLNIFIDIILTFLSWIVSFSEKFTKKEILLWVSEHAYLTHSFWLLSFLLRHPD